MRSLKTFLLLALVALWLGGCALHPFSSITPGMARDEVLSRMGKPTATVALPQGQGTRLQYSGQPGGQYAFMVDIDAAGKVSRARQVLTAEEFARINSGQWTREDVVREFGPPAFIERVASWQGDILTYRWYGFQDMFYWVYLDSSQLVQKSHAGVEERISIMPDAL